MIKAVTPVSGEKVRELVAEVYRMPPEVVGTAVEASPEKKR